MIKFHIFPQLPPTNQKRMVAFINHFVLSTVNFLNKFASDCESKFIQYEHKIQSLEASLSIVEAKIASIDTLQNGTVATEERPQGVPMKENYSTNEPENASVVEESSRQETPAKDPRYDKYIKMVQVGVPLPAVKNKICSEGLDPNYIDAFL